MPTALTSGARVRTNSPAENAYNSLVRANRDIANRQLRLSTGKRINAASDDVAGYITARSMSSRVGSLRSSLQAVGDAKNTAVIAQDSLENINSLLETIKESASTAASGALGTDEKVTLAQAAFRLTEQIQTIVDSTVFGGYTLLGGSYSGDFVIGFKADNSLITMAVDLSTASNSTFAVDVRGTSATSFAGVEGLNLNDLSNSGVTSSDLGIFAPDEIATTIASLSTALNNVNKFASYLGGVVNRLDSQELNLQSQITNYNSAISRIQDADVAVEQLALIRAQFLQQTSVSSLAQANQNPQAFLQLL